MYDLAGRRRFAEARGPQPERREEARAHQVFPRFASHTLHHRADDRVAGVGVNPVRARRVLGVVF